MMDHGAAHQHVPTYLPTAVNPEMMDKNIHSMIFYLRKSECVYRPDQTRWNGFAGIRCGIRNVDLSCSMPSHVAEHVHLHYLPKPSGRAGGQGKVEQLWRVPQVSGMHASLVVI